MKGYGGFESRKKRSSLRPVPDYDKVTPTRDRLTELLKELKKSRLSPRTVGMLRKLAGLAPVIRLVINLKTVLGLMAQGNVTNILVEGITDDERRVLLEISGSGLSGQSKETAHALFGLDGRMRAVTSLHSTFRKARTARSQELSEKEINEIMED